MFRRDFCLPTALVGARAVPASSQLAPYDYSLLMPIREWSGAHPKRSDHIFRKAGFGSNVERSPSTVQRRQITRALRRRRQRLWRPH